MSLKIEDQIIDDFRDNIWNCLDSLHSVSSWSKEKFGKFAELEKRLQDEGYLKFTGDYRDYHLERKGQACLYVIPETQRGALKVFRGKLIRLICAGSWDQYGGRYLFGQIHVDKPGG